MFVLAATWGLSTAIAVVVGFLAINHIGVVAVLFFPWIFAYQAFYKVRRRRDWTLLPMLAMLVFLNLGMSTLSVISDEDKLATFLEVAPQFVMISAWILATAFLGDLVHNKLVRHEDKDPLGSL